MAIGTAAALIGSAVVSTAGSAIAGSAAKKRQQSAQQLQQQNRSEALEFAEADPREIAALEQATQTAEFAFNTQQRNIERQEKLVQAIDPTLAEAGRQAFELLQGGESKRLAAGRKRAEQRLQDRLREQGGSGAETSTFGAQAFGELEAQQAGLQQAELAQLLGVSLQARPDIGLEAGRLGQLGQVQQGIAGGFGNIKNRQVQAALGTNQQAPQGPSTGGLIGGSLAGIGSTLLGSALGPKPTKDA